MLNGCYRDVTNVEMGGGVKEVLQGWYRGVT